MQMNHATDAQSAPTRLELLLEAILEAQSILISASDDAEAVETALQLIGAATGVESAHVYQNHIGYMAERRLASERFFWDRDIRLGSFMYSESEWLDYDVFKPGSFDDLSALKVLQIRISDLPANQQQFFAAQRVSSILMVPIDVEGSAWGFLGLVQRGGAARTWTSKELHVLTIAAKSIGECMSRIIAQESLKLYREIVLTMRDGLAILDKSGCYVEQNGSREQLLGYRIDEIAGQTPMFHFGDQVAAEIFGGLLDKGIFHRELEALNKSGHRLTLAVTTFPVNDEYGEPTCYLEVIQDITQRKLQENAIMEAKTIAEEANRAKSEFLANMSHEIRTPMNGVIGMTRLLQETKLGEQQMDYVMTLRSSGEQLMKIINDILDFSKIEAGKLQLEIMELETHRLIEEAVELFSARAKESQLELSYMINLDVPEVLEGDVLRIGQILNNLINNAIKFTKSGSVHVEMSVAASGLESPFHYRERTYHPMAKEAKDITMLLFTVKDTGIGLKQDKLLAMFEPFTQADSSTTRRFGGTGLGLSISKLICELMGGTIWAESVEGQGSTFFFTVPLRRSQFEPSDYVLHNQRYLAGKSILCIEQSAGTARVINTYAKHWGMKVHTPLTTKEMVAAALMPGKKLPEIVITDLDLLRRSGVAAADLQKMATSQGSTAAFLVPFGTIFHADRHPGLERPVLLNKPISPSGLHKCLIDAVGCEALPQPRMVPRVTHSFDVSTAPPRKKDLNILVVEDNFINQKVIQEYLNKLGYKSDTCDNGSDSIKKVIEKAYDLIFMDVQMPDMDGFDATRGIRAALAGRPQPAIIALTARAMKGDREECLAAGMDDYITKPVEISKLREVIFKRSYTQ